MAIKQRKQVTGTTEQINAYAGVEGQLVWDKTKKKWVGMSGTAGTNYPMASERHQHSIANVTNLQKALDEKATKTELTNGLAGKANASHTHTIANVTGLQDALNGKLATTAKIPYSQITGTPSIPDVSGLIPKTGDRGTLVGYETITTEGSTDVTVDRDTPDTFLTSGAIKAKALDPGNSNECWTKVCALLSTSPTVTLGYGWVWQDGKAPTLKRYDLVVFNTTRGLGTATHNHRA